MFGFFDIGVPSFIANRMNANSGGGYVGAVLLGCIGAVLAGPCSGPVVASILALIGQKGEVGFGGGLMFAFALGMGMIFLVTGAAGGWLPQRGAWMVTVKKSFGVVLWLGAIFYASSHLSTTVTALSTAAVLLVTGVFGWPDPEDGEGMMIVRARQLYAVVAGIVGAYLLLGTLATQGFILPAMSMSGGGAATADAGPKITWVRTEAEAIELAKASGKPMMIDFTAEWCQACHEMERFTYTDAAVIAQAGGFVTAMIDCTEKADPGVLAIQKKYGVSGLPTVVFAMPDGRVLGGTVGFVKAPDFIVEMKKALEAKG
jgi:thiol:disulfide interchange protein DsbD